MSFLVRAFLALIFCLLAPPMRGQYVYVTNRQDNTVSAFSYLAIDAKSRFLYVTDFGSVLAYAIGAKGALTSIATYAIGVSPQGLALDPTDSYLYVVFDRSNNILGYSVGTDGSLTVLPSSPFPVGNKPFWIAITR